MQFQDVLMNKSNIKIYHSELPNTGSLGSFLENTIFSFEKLTKLPEEISIPSDEGAKLLLIHEYELCKEVFAVVAAISKVEKSIPLVIIGEKFSQNYLENLFPNRPFSYFQSSLTPEELSEDILKTVNGQAKYIPEHDYMEELKIANSNIEALHAIGIALSAETDPDKLLDLILTQSLQITNADAGSLFLVEPNSKLRFKLSQNFSLDWVSKRKSTNSNQFAKYCRACCIFAKKASILLDAYKLNDDFPFKFNKSFDKNSGYRTKSMLTVPMINHVGEVLGVVQLINKRADFNERKPGVPLDENMVLSFLQ